MHALQDLRAHSLRTRGEEEEEEVAPDAARSLYHERALTGTGT